MADPVQVEKYGRLTWQDNDLDAARATLCLCLRCARLKIGNASDNCMMASVMFTLCQAKGMAVAISRCADFSEVVK